MADVKADMDIVEEKPDEVDDSVSFDGVYISFMEEVHDQMLREAEEASQQLPPYI